MKKTIKRALALLMVAMLTVGTGMTVMASQWQQNATGWWYQNDDGTWPANGWQWIDGNGDGVAECYYFDGNGYMLSNTTTPDGYQVNIDGAWTVNGVVQTQGAVTNPGNNTGYNSYGISNAAIDMLNSTKEGNAAKYGAVEEFESSGRVYVNYSNGFTIEYYKGISNRVTTQKPSTLLKGIDDSISKASGAETNLKSNGYTDTYNDGINTVTKINGYQLIWRPSGPLIEIAKINN